MTSTAAPAVPAAGPTGAAGARPAAGDGAAARGRLDWVDAVRGAACLCVVAYHVIGNDPTHGLRQPAGSFAWTVARLLDLFQMPLFAFVSGRVFAIACTDRTAFLAAAGRKLVRIGVPLLWAITLYRVAAGAMGQAGDRPFWSAYLLPYEHLWYLQATLWLIAAASLGSLLFAARPLAFAVGAFAVSVVAFEIDADPGFDLLALREAVYLAPFFFLGLALRRAGESGFAFEGSRDRRFAAALLGLGIVGAGWTAAVADPETGVRAQSAPALLLALAIVGVVALRAPRMRALAVLSRYSYTIYIYHILAIVPTRLVLLKLWPGAPVAVLFAVLLGVGVGLPVLLHQIGTRHRLGALLIEGVRRPAARNGAGGTA